MRVSDRRGASLALTLLACSAAALPSQEFRLSPLQRFGWEDPAGPAGSTPAQRRLDGGMLSNIADLAEGADGALYVLDNRSPKVIVFNRDGTVRRVMGNGKGEGPGEFSRPVSLAVAKNGDLFVADVAQQRISVFAAGGAFTRSFTIASPYVSQIRLVGDRLHLIQYVFRKEAPAVLVYSTSGALLEKKFPPTEEDASFGRTGNGYRAAILRDGQLAIAHFNPGTWSLVESPAHVFGKPLVPGNTVHEVKASGTWVAPATIRGFGELSEGRYALLFERLRPETVDDPEHPRWDIYLALTRADGTPLGTLKMPEGGRAFLVSRDGRSIYRSFGDPFVGIDRFRVDSR
ncbi:MAG: 6-bladed beta-propeller [Gemmatimonadota bacterium]